MSVDYQEVAEALRFATRRAAGGTRVRCDIAIDLCERMARGELVERERSRAEQLLADNTAVRWHHLCKEDGHHKWIAEPYGDISLEVWQDGSEQWQYGVYDDGTILYESVSTSVSLSEMQGRAVQRLKRLERELEKQHD